MASGYIAGGAIAGIAIAIMSGGLAETSAAIDAAMNAHNPFYGGAWADALSLIPFLALTALLWWTATRAPRRASS
jgi:hypothetical protein